MTAELALLRRRLAVCGAGADVPANAQRGKCDLPVRVADQAERVPGLDPGASGQLVDHSRAD